MTIDLEFPKNHVVMGKHSTSDGTYSHFVWGPGRKDAESSTNKEVQDAYKTRGEEYVPLGVHGTYVAVDWDSCISDGACVEACPVQVYQWYRSEQDVPAVEMVNAVSEGIGDDHNREGRKDFTDKPDLIRESNCIWCMACVTVCPTNSIKVDEANLSIHEEEAQKFVDS